MAPWFIHFCWSQKWNRIILDSLPFPRFSSLSHQEILLAPPLTFILQLWICGLSPPALPPSWLIPPSVLTCFTAIASTSTAVLLQSFSTESKLPEFKRDFFLMTFYWSWNKVYFFLSYLQGPLWSSLFLPLWTSLWHTSFLLITLGHISVSLSVSSPFPCFPCLEYASFGLWMMDVFSAFISLPLKDLPQYPC